jgi:MoxR-like ATPase
LSHVPLSPAELQGALAGRSYLADRGLATVVSICLTLRKPLLLEGEAGVGKTELAKTLAEVLEARLIRLQCYEGIDVAHAVYDWNYARQMLHIRALEAAAAADPGNLDDLFGPRFLVRRPLLDAIENDDAVPPVLLIDEIDRADDEFEAFLLELLSDFQVTIPELGTVRATALPVVVITSNRTRELHDALKRRCLYHWIAYPDPARETEIVLARVGAAPKRLAREASSFVARLRQLQLTKPPGTAETVDWVASLVALQRDQLDPDAVDSTLGVVLKYEEDLELTRSAGIGALLADAKERR